MSFQIEAVQESADISLSLSASLRLFVSPPSWALEENLFLSSQRRYSCLSACLCQWIFTLLVFSMTLRMEH